MKRYLITIISLVVAFIVSGCGGGGSDNVSNSDGVVSASAALTSTADTLSVDGNGTFDTKILFSKNVDSSYKIRLNEFSIDIQGCSITSVSYTPESIDLNGTRGSSATVAVHGIVTDPGNCTTDYTLTVHQTTTRDGRSSSRYFTVVHSSAPDSGGGSGTATKSFAYPTTPLTIDRNATTYTIKVMVIEDGYAVVGQEVKAKAFDPKYGQIKDPTQYTQRDGFAVFEYVSPSTLPTDGTSTTIELTMDDNGTIITQDIVLNFNSAQQPPEDKAADIYLSPTSFIVTQANAQKTIRITTVNADNRPISTDVEVEVPSTSTTDYGTFDRYSITTDTNGEATITYTAPDDISTLDERNITINVKDDITITKELSITYDTQAQSDQYEIDEAISGFLTVDERGNIGIKIAKVSTGDAIADQNVHEVNLTSRYSNILRFENNSTTFSYQQRGDKNDIIVIGQRVSGVAIIDVSASIYDGVNNVVLTKSIPLTVLSGPVASVTIPYIKTAKCTGNSNLSANVHVVHAVDKYGNPAQATIVPTVITEAKVIVPNPNIPSVPGTGSIDASNFTDASQDFTASNISADTDHLIITPNSQRDDYSYLGNWTIKSVNTTALELSEEYQDAAIDNLSYIIGDKDRLLGREVVNADVSDPTGKYVTDATGKLPLEVCFDPMLAGHTFTLGVYAQDKTHRAGIALIQSFRWDSFSSGKETIDNNGSTQTVYLGLKIEDPENPLIDVDIVPSSFKLETKPHCDINETASDFHTNDYGQVKLVINTDGNRSSTGGVDECTVEWDASIGNIYYEY